MRMPPKRRPAPAKVSAKAPAKPRPAARPAPKPAGQAELKVRACVNRLKRLVAAHRITPVAVCGKGKCSEAEYRAKCGQGHR
jgi:hypothetical protein